MRTHRSFLWAYRYVYHLGVLNHLPRLVKWLLFYLALTMIMEALMYFDYYKSANMVFRRAVVPHMLKVPSNSTHFYLCGSWGSIVEVSSGCTVHPLFDAFAISCLPKHFIHEITIVVEVMDKLHVHFAVCETCSTQYPLAVRRLPSHKQANWKKKSQRIELILPPQDFSCFAHPRDNNSFFGIPAVGLDDRRCLFRFDFFVSLSKLTPSTPPICFAAVGDWGAPRRDQAKVIKELQRLMKRNWVKFIVSTGDNLYPIGVVSADDPTWKTHFEDPFSDEVFQKVMFLISLGNHDLCSGGEHQVKYSKKHPRWFLPEAHYALSIPLIGKANRTGNALGSFDVLDVSVLNSYDDSSWDSQVRKGSKFFASREEKGNHRWRLVVNHEPVFSSGLHGLTEERNLPFRERILPFLNECKINLYLNGDDHFLEVHHYHGTDFVTTGAGGGATLYSSQKRMPTTVWRPEINPGSKGPGMMTVIGPTLHCTLPFSDKIVTTLYDVSKGKEKLLYGHNTFYRRSTV